MIVDAHVHLARELTGFRKPLRHGKVVDGDQVSQWFPPAFDPPASTAETLLAYMDDAEVDRAIIVQHYLYGDQNETVTAAVTGWPDRLAGYAFLGAFDQPDDPDRLERLIEGGLLGLKIELATTRRLRPSFRFDGDHEWRIWERLNALGRPLALDLIGTPPSDVPALRRMLDEFPRLQLVNCHVGGPGDPNWEEKALLGRHPRVWSDLAALPLFLSKPVEEYPFPKAQEFIRWTIEHIGADRIMWGTDYPPMLSLATYRQWRDLVRVHCGLLTDAQRADILGGTAQRFLAQFG
jgi:predicted TIM-barrel fold metal-dependent hydrolase